MPVSSRLARNVPSMRPTVGKFCTPEKPSAFSSVEEDVHAAERIGAVDAGEHRRVLHHRQHLAAISMHDLRWRRRRPSGRRASRARPCGSGRNCRSRSGRRRRPPRIWPRGPVPAPPPTIGSPRATMARNLSISAERSEPHGYLAALRRTLRPPCTVRNASSIAAANAGSLMCAGTRTSWRVDVWRTVCSSARNSAASAAWS